MKSTSNRAPATELLSRFAAIVGEKYAVTDPAVLAQARAVGVELTPMTPAEFGRFIAAEAKKWAQVVKASGAKID